MIKGKNLQTRKPYPTTLSFRFDEEINWFTDKQKISQYHETSFATNAKETSLKWKRKSHNKKQENNKMGKFTGKGKHIAKMGNHLYTYDI